MPTLTGLAPAKINLGLRILGRLPGGYHEVRTVLQTISLSDALSVSYNSRGKNTVSLDCNVEKFSFRENVAAKAAQALLNIGQYRGKVSIRLVKNIPVGSGLGGGSSDAAAVLTALRILLRPEPSVELLTKIAVDIGSDVPFFLVGGTAVGIGRGEEVYPLPDPPRRWLVVLSPETPSSTKEAYQRLARSRSKSGLELTVERQQHIISGFRSNIFGPNGVLASTVEGVPPNDFEAVLSGAYPELRKWKQQLLRAGASVAALSGSGSALFGIFANRSMAIQARKSFKLFPGRSYIVKTLDRKTCRSIWRRED